ncbi:hypothetical protein P4234_28240 [Pseudomonas aeruginosa]|nr:hypothetical protein [Pseudomonas aeruginosa]
MDTLRAEALGFLGVAESATHHEMAGAVRQGPAGLHRERRRVRAGRCR